MFQQPQTTPVSKGGAGWRQANTGKIITSKHAELSDASFDAPAEFQQIDGCLG
jgi:hypothetical protein